jgi:hypothetical protein
VTRSGPLQHDHAYRAALSQKHRRKSGFWSLVKVRK